MDPITQANMQAAAGAAGADPVYVDQVYGFRTYHGSGSSQTITTQVDTRASEGGAMVWTKKTNTNSDWNFTDSHLGRGGRLLINDHIAFVSESSTDEFTSFNDNGFTIGGNSTYNSSADEYAAFTFKNHPGFIDTITYSGNGVSGRQLAHNLGCEVGMVWVKCWSHSSSWRCWHRSLYGQNAGTHSSVVNSPGTRSQNGSSHWNNTAPTSTHVTVGGSADVNESGKHYIMKVFASGTDAGSKIFGENADENIISCGNYVGNGSSDGIDIDFGFRPQMFVIINRDTSRGWHLQNVFQGQGLRPGLSSSRTLALNLTDGEFSGGPMHVTHNGVRTRDSSNYFNSSGQVYYYFAIREDNRPATDIKDPSHNLVERERYAGNGSTDRVRNLTNAAGHPPATILSMRTTGGNPYIIDRIRGGHWYWPLAGNSAGGLQTSAISQMDHRRLQMDGGPIINNSSSSYDLTVFKKAKYFHDIVYYDGDNSSTRDISHRLGATPTFVIIRAFEEAAYAMYMFTTSQLNTGNGFFMPGTGGLTGNGPTAAVSSTTFRPKKDATGDRDMNKLGYKYIAYLFGDVAGQSKAGKYVGGSGNIEVDIGFQPDQIIIKGDQSNREPTKINYINAGNDQKQRMDSTSDPEITNSDFVDLINNGFRINSNAPSDLYSSSSGDGFYYFAYKVN
jgi:hypothetical protein